MGSGGAAGPRPVPTLPAASSSTSPAETFRAEELEMLADRCS